MRNSFDAKSISMLHEMMGECRLKYQGREPINSSGFDFYTRKSLVIKKEGKEITLDPDETMFLLNELKITLSNKEEDDE